jgi:hypothetical protein
MSDDEPVDPVDDWRELAISVNAAKQAFLDADDSYAERGVSLDNDVLASAARAIL